MSGSPKPRRGHSESPRKRDPERKTVFKRLKKGVFHRLEDKGEYIRILKLFKKVKVVPADIGSKSQRDKSQVLRTICPNHRSEDLEDHLKIFQAAATTKRWAMPTWSHMFNSTLIGNTRVWFNDLSQEIIDSYDDLKKAFLENYLQQKNASNTRLKFTTSSREMRKPRKSLCEGTSSNAKM
nr:reverse transcriptase domain-containing protein [Tanacetum cinerariifolium]